MVGTPKPCSVRPLLARRARLAANPFVLSNQRHQPISITTCNAAAILHPQFLFETTDAVSPDFIKQELIC
jgi:hypothetical protein